MHIDYTIYEKTRFVIIAMLALKPSNDDEEREAIFSALDNNHKIEVSNNINQYKYIELYFVTLGR